MKVSRAEVVELLEALVAVTPEEHLVAGASRSSRCHHCLASGGRRHSDVCPWLEALILLRGDDAFRGILVGEDEEDFEPDEAEDESPTREQLRESAAAARREVAAAFGGPSPPAEVPRDLVEDVLDPLDEPEPFDGSERTNP